MRRQAAAVTLLAMATLAHAGTVTPEAVAQQLGDREAAPFVLDVRTEEEFTEGRVPGAVNIPVDQLEARLQRVPKDRPVVVYCASGGRAAKAGRLLAAHGYTNVSEMAGSFTAWRKAGLPVEK